MNRRTLHTTLLALFGALLAAAAPAAPPRDLDLYVKRVQEKFEVPGITVVFVERDGPSIVRTYGIRRMGEAAKVDANTLFAVGSTTKAFTSTLLAMLVDAGRLTWDTKVVDVLPDFRMYDAYTSAEITIRDLLTHRSGLGLGAGDLLFVPATTLSRAEVVQRLRHIKPATSFRSRYAYDNLLYVVAGRIVETLEGKSWEEVIRERIFDPLQMTTTSATSTLPAAANRAWPHGRTSQALRGSGPIAPLEEVMVVGNAGPAGAINTSGAEIARWLEVQLGHGLDPRTGKRLFSEAQAREMWTAQTLVPIARNPPALALAQANFRAYTLGWNLSDYRGEPIIAHGGGVLGMVTQFVVVPRLNVAFALLSNAEETLALSAIQYRLLDALLGQKSPDWVGMLSQYKQERLAKAAEQLAATTAQPPGGVRGPSLELQRYAGRYRDAWYGLVTIENTPSGLAIRFEHTPAFQSQLEHVRYDTFRTRWADRSLEDAYVTFALEPDGSIERMTMQAISPLADFSFDFHDLLFVPEATTRGQVLQ